LWKTENEATTWQPVFEQGPATTIGDVAIAPSNPDIVWIGTGEANIFRSSQAGAGVYKSTDAGKTWQHMGLTDSYTIPRILIHPANPDVVFVGEMRDAKTVTAGMRAAETGHMVMGTMHSSNASQAVHRLLDLFPQNERELVRQALALAVRAIISQALLPSIKEGTDRIPAAEVLLASPGVRKLISEGREADLPSVIRGSQREGMLDLNDSLCKLVQEGWIDPKDAYNHAPNADELKMALKGIRTTAEGIL